MSTNTAPIPWGSENPSEVSIQPRTDDYISRLWYQRSKISRGGRGFTGLVPEPYVEYAFLTIIMGFYFTIYR